MNTVLINYDDIKCKNCLHKVYDPSDHEKFRINIDFTDMDIINIIGFYRNGIYVDRKEFLYKNGIFETSNYDIDEKDKVYFICLLNDTTSKKYLMQYPISSYTVEEGNIITLHYDNSNIRQNYIIRGIIVNGVLYGFDDIEVIDTSKIKFKVFDILPEKDLIRLLISAELEN